MMGILYCKFDHHANSLILYLAYIHPHLEYALAVWDLNQQGLINSLERVQKLALKMCPKNWVLIMIPCFSPATYLLWPAEETA